ncbi:unnamed protein product [Orchesella dallaii]|uniref:Tetraspanin n=1 Tax=Orchesella dallaii TaxID=48710 RepID=A0ABP1RZN8_9HEXA
MASQAGGFPPPSRSVVSLPPPQAPGQISVNVEEEIFDDEYDDEYYDEEEPEVLTGVTKQKRRIVLTKRTYLLVAFVIIAGLGAAGLVLAYRKVDEWGGEYPPTVKSQDAFTNTLTAIFVITIITPIGFVILKFRITNLLVGFVYMFCLVVCIFFSMKGISSAYYSYIEDTDFTIHQFYASSHDTSLLNDFWQFHQSQHKCCGTKHIDIVDDWPGFLKTSRLPESCCTDEWLEELNEKYPNVGANNLRKNCGKGLGRIREHPLKPKLPKRVYSGFFLSLSDKEVAKFESKYKIINPENYFVLMLDVRTKFNETLNALEAFRLNWKTYYVDNVYNQIGISIFSRWVSQFRPEEKNIALVDELYFIQLQNKTKLVGWKNESGRGRVINDILYQADLDHTMVEENMTVGVIGGNSSFLNALCVNISKQNHELRGSPEEYCQKRIFKTRQKANTLGRELLLRMDFLTTYLHVLGDTTDEEELEKLEGKPWALWKIPTNYETDEIYPYKLAANLFRKNHKKMYYMSRGIAENYVLDGIVHGMPCELAKEKKFVENLRMKTARDLNKRWRKYGKVAKWKNPDEGLGLFYLEYVHEVAFIAIIVGGSCIGCVIVIAVIFWQYYSRIKAEEYANLALPKEFEILNLKRGSMIDEADIQRVSKKKKTGNKVRPGGVPLAHAHHLPFGKGLGRGGVGRGGVGRGGLGRGAFGRGGLGRGGVRRPGQQQPPFGHPRGGPPRFSAPPHGGGPPGLRHHNPGGIHGGGPPPPRHPGGPGHFGPRQAGPAGHFGPRQAGPAGQFGPSQAAPAPRQLAPPLQQPVGPRPPN